MGARLKTRLAAALVALAAAASLVLAGCGEEEELEVIDGEPVELGEERYNVVITRFLNPDDVEDGAYLEGVPDPPPGEQYLGVFLTVENEGDEPVTIPEELEVVDTTGTSYHPVETDNPYGLPLGGTLAAGDELPAPDTPAANGPIEGSMVLFLVPDAVTENRPLELEIPSASGDGTVELDI